MKLIHRDVMNAFVALAFLVFSGSLRAQAVDEQTLALTGATIYTAPDAAPIANGVVLIRGDKIAAVETKGAIAVPANATVLDCAGLTITAGFQNSHVHFIESKWDDAARQPAGKLKQQLGEMLVRYGFTTVVDTGSDPRNTIPMRKRIEAGEIAGPRILTAGSALYPPDGIPFYVRRIMPKEMLKLLDQPGSPEAAVEAAERNFARGTDILKLFTGSLLTPEQVKPMPVEIAQAAAKAAHRRGKLVFAHPSNMEGIQVSLQSGVDVLVHTAPRGGDWSQALLEEMKSRHTSLIPTLQLWGFEMRKAKIPEQAAAGFTADGVVQLQAFAKAGGQVLFGTDVGYMTDYDPSEEFALMARAGMTPRQILASLTTEPAKRFREEKRHGVVGKGMDADLVVLEGDPVQDVRQFTKVRYTVRGGRVIYRNDARTK